MHRELFPVTVLSGGMVAGKAPNACVAGTRNFGFDERGAGVLQIVQTASRAIRRGSWNS